MHQADTESPTKCRGSWDQLANLQWVTITPRCRAEARAVCATSASAALLGTGAPQKASPKRSPIPHPGGHRGPKGGDPTPGPRGQPRLGRDGAGTRAGRCVTARRCCAAGGRAGHGPADGVPGRAVRPMWGEKAPLMGYRGAGTAAGERDRAPLMGYREGRY